MNIPESTTDSKATQRKNRLRSIFRHPSLWTSLGLTLCAVMIGGLFLSAQSGMLSHPGESQVLTNDQSNPQSQLTGADSPILEKVEKPQIAEEEPVGSTKNTPSSSRTVSIADDTRQTDRCTPERKSLIKQTYLTALKTEDERHEAALSSYESMSGVLGNILYNRKQEEFKKHSDIIERITNDYLNDLRVLDC